MARRDMAPPQQVCSEAAPRRPARHVPARHQPTRPRRALAGTLASTLGLLATAPLGGCASFGVEHMLGDDGPLRQHRWHQWPARVGMFALTVPLTIVVAPFALLEDQLTGSSLFRKQSPGVTSYLVGLPATVGAYAVATPFWLLGLPWEFDGPPPPPPPDPVLDDDGTD